ncbi:MAG TPA: LCP family protein [Streptosporangiaceae bacterium]|nr:LCP family protein [Streptosporangiaceae bacterium]
MTADDQNPAGRGGGDPAEVERDPAEVERDSAEVERHPEVERDPADGGRGPADDEQAEAPREPAERAAASRGQGGQGGQGESAPRTPNYHAARRRFMRQVAITRHARRQRFLLTAVAVVSAVTLLVSCGAWVVTTYISAGLGRLDAGISGTPSSGPINILVVGIDTRSGLSRSQEIGLHVGNDVGANTDTMMLVHVPANHQSVEVISLPRDSWVDIPGHGMNKINAAYALGGPRLMVSTVEQATGLDINDYVEVNFVGFVNVVNALGGVNICLPYAVDDSYSGLHLSAGLHHVDGVTALQFARDRHSFATSDLARIDDQQQLLSSAFTEATASGVVANPVRLQQVLASVTAAVKVDQGFNLVELADELRGVKPSNIWFTTVPIATLDYQTPSGESAVLWNQTAAAALFQSLQTDTGSPELARHARGPGTVSDPAEHSAAEDACG